jgi:hypothetical protein
MQLTKPPITSAEIDPAWPEAVRSATPMPKLRAGSDNTIEGWSEARGRYMRIMLPGGATSFATEADRDLVLGAIMGLNVMSTPEPAA